MSDTEATETAQTVDELRTMLEASEKTLEGVLDELRKAKEVGESRLAIIRTEQNRIFAYAADLGQVRQAQQELIRAAGEAIIALKKRQPGQTIESLDHHPAVQRLAILLGTLTGQNP